MITPYPVHKRGDSVLQRLGEDAGHDALEDIHDDGAESDGDSSQETDSDSAVAGEGGVAVAGDDAGDVQSASQADAAHQSQITIAALEANLNSLRAVGSLRAAQCIEFELQKEMRKRRQLVKESPAVAETFLDLRWAAEQEALAKRRCLEQAKDRKKEADKAIAVRDAAVAELRRTKRSLQELENTRECRHALKNFSLEALGAGSANAGGARAKKNRFEVLDRLSRQKAGLSAGQKNDWAWFKEEWDKAMVSEHKSNWARVFAW